MQLCKSSLILMLCGFIYEISHNIEYYDELWYYLKYKVTI
jgi:hypothetical protein